MGGVSCIEGVGVKYAVFIFKYAVGMDGFTGRV
jgi:hypothetical protein